MPSPFPGMDPYLEDQEHWMNVHASLITEIGSRLTEQLRPRYFGRIAQRAYLTKDDDPAWKTIILDAYLVVTPPMSGGRRGSSPSASRSDLNDPSLENESGGVAVAVRGEALSGLHDILVDHAQGAEAGVRGVVIVCE